MVGFVNADEPRTGYSDGDGDEERMRIVYIGHYCRKMNRSQRLPHIIFHMRVILAFWLDLNSELLWYPS